MRRAALALLALAACRGGGKQPSPSFDRDSIAQVAPDTMISTRAAPILPGTTTSTLAWVDTVKLDDSAYVFRSGRDVTTSTTQRFVDSTWIVAIPVHGLPFGLFATWNGNQLRPGADVFTMTYGGENVSSLGARLRYARTHHFSMVTAMTGGARANYQSIAKIDTTKLAGGKIRVDTTIVFDLSKWRAKMKTFDSDSVRKAVAEARAFGTLVANSVMDEPFNEGGPGNEANAWHWPPGTDIKLAVDSLCTIARRVLHRPGEPDLPQVVFQNYTLGAQTSYKSCDGITSQYGDRKGPVTAYRDGALAECARERISCSFGINVPDGGPQASRRKPDGTDKTTYAPGDCPNGRGTYFPNCRMSPALVRQSGWTLGTAGCFLTGFRYDPATMADTAYVHAFRDVSDSLAKLPRRPCKRP